MESTTIKASLRNRKILRKHAREAMSDYSPIMTWLTVDADGDLHIIVEPQGQSYYTGQDTVIARTGDSYKAHGQGAVHDNGKKYRTARSYLIDLLGYSEYRRIFQQ